MTSNFYFEGEDYMNTSQINFHGAGAAKNDDSGSSKLLQLHRLVTGFV
jgi:hypothetical protein